MRRYNMIAFEVINDCGEVVIDVFVSRSDLIGIAKTIRIEQLADKVNAMAGMECTGFARTQVSCSGWAFAQDGYLLRCRNLASVSMASDVRRTVERVLEAIKEDRI